MLANSNSQKAEASFIVSKTSSRNAGTEAYNSGSRGQKHNCNSKFSSSISTGGIKTQLPLIQNSIGSAQRKTQSSTAGLASVKAALVDVKTKIDNLMESLGAQAGGKGACGAAGQMSNMVEKLDEVSVSKRPAKQEIMEILNDISELLTKLENTMHTNAHANMKFNGNA